MQENTNEAEQYKTLMTEIIHRQSVILGPNLAIMKARHVEEIKVDDEGNVKDVAGSSMIALQKLVDVYVALSGDIVKSALGPVFDRYPGIKKVE